MERKYGDPAHDHQKEDGYNSRPGWGDCLELEAKSS
jgi:hypothetical protein